LTTLTEKLLRRAERMSTRKEGKHWHSTHRKYSAWFFFVAQSL